MRVYGFELTVSSSEYEGVTYTHNHVHASLSVCMHGRWTTERAPRWDGWINGQMDGWISGSMMEWWMDGWMDGRLDESSDSLMYTLTYCLSFVATQSDFDVTDGKYNRIATS